MLDAELGEKIAEGRTAEVFAYGTGRVLKLFRKEFPASAAERDYRVSAQAARLYPGAPAVYGKPTVEGRIGIVYERLEGSSLVKVMATKPWKTRWAAGVCARLHCAVLQCPADGLPNQKEAIESAIRRARELRDDVKEPIIAYLSTLPGGDRICHGDFHPDNIFLSKRGPVVIDWMTATKGNPAADLARSLLIMGSPTLPPGLPAAIMPLAWLLKKRFSVLYRRFVLRICGIAERDIDAWMLPLAAARLPEWNPPAETRYLLKIIEARLAALQS
jgi:aminoglycoside phosphotransferase (APT) family kinase protein